MKLLKFAFLLMFFMLISCSDNSKDLNRVKLIYSILKVEYAPDEKTELFNIKFDTTNDKLTLTGEVTNLTPYYKLKNSLTRKRIKYNNKVRLLPDSAVGNQWFAVVKKSIIDLRNKPTNTSKLINQGLLGMPLKVLDKKGDFYRIQTPDRLISWADKSEINRMTKKEFIEWNKSEKVIFTEKAGYVFTNSSFKETVSDITLGSILKLVTNHKKYYEVEYPDKRKGFIKKQKASLYSSWVKNLPSDDLMNRRQNNIENIAKSFIDIPYLLGGTSTKGLDNSGFIKLVYLMNGFIIPKDVTQQINVGKTVGKNLDFSELNKGDLIFFGEKATEEKGRTVNDVAIWLGNNQQEFIHVIDKIRISSMDENHPLFNKFLKDTYIASKSCLGTKHKNIIDLKEYKITKRNIRRFIPLYKNKSKF